MAALKDWRDNDNRTVVCGGSLTNALQCGDVAELFRSLHLLLHRLRKADAFVHFHLDPEVVDPVDRRTLEQLFDRVVEEPRSRLWLDEPEAPTDIVMEMLEQPSRRYALRVILTVPEPVSVDELAERIVVRNQDGLDDRPDSTEVKKRKIGLLHNHLPKLDGADFVEFDREASTVRPGSDIDQVRPLLERINE